MRDQNPYITPLLGRCSVQPVARTSFGLRGQSGHDTFYLQLCCPPSPRPSPQGEGETFAAVLPKVREGLGRMVMRKFKSAEAEGLSRGRGFR
jgi:hypothetical protein